MATVFELLERDLRRLRADPRAAERLATACAAAGGVASLAELERYVRTAPPAHADRVLVALVRGAVDDDDLAATVLLQLLLPGARRRTSSSAMLARRITWKWSTTTRAAGRPFAMAVA